SRPLTYSMSLTDVRACERSAAPASSQTETARAVVAAIVMDRVLFMRFNLARTGPWGGARRLDGSGTAVVSRATGAPMIRGVAAATRLGRDNIVGSLRSHPPRPLDSIRPRPVAQLAEQQALNLRGVGAIPTRLTSLRSDFSRRLSAGALAKVTLTLDAS